MSLFAVATILLLGFTQPVLSQVTGNFCIGGQIYPSQNQQYDAIYIYDQSRGSPAPFNFTCTSTQGTLLDVRTTNELISLQSLIGTRVVDNVTITGTSSPVTLDFNPEFLPQFSGIYSCINEGQNIQEAVIITTENPFLCLNTGLVTVTGSADMFNITVMSVYTASGGVSLRPTLEDYSLVYFLGGEAVAVQDLMFVMDLTPYEQVFLVDVGQNIRNGTNFNLTLSVSGLTTSVIFPVIVPVCPQELDMGYGIPWGNTAPGESLLQSCGAGYIGNATRYCQNDARWAPPDVSWCENVLFAMLRITGEDFYSNVTVVDEATLAMALDIVSELAIYTDPTSISIFPRDLNTSNYIIANTVDFLLLSLEQSGTTDITASTEVVEVIGNLLNQVNLAGFEDLQAEEPAGQSVLNNAERYALYLATAMSQNTSEQGILLSRRNIVIRSERITVTNGTQSTDVTFPQEVDLGNFTISSGLSPAVITIPAQLIVERSNSSTVAVAHTLFQNLQDFLPPELNNSTAVPVSLIISSQVAAQSGDSMSSQTLQESPVTITFTVEGATGEDFTCVFWNFSEPIGNGGWSTDGVATTVQVTQEGNITVQCNSTHLSSFAVLSMDVDVAGTPVNRRCSLRDISYIALAVSLACLLLTIIFFLSLGKKLFKQVHNFVHLNLAIALFVGYLTFAFGVELAASNEAACQAVTAIMQYFFLASFCWMLCEGIMAYLLLVVVFNSLSKKWWFFLILGWTPPIIFVVIGLTTILDGYVVFLRNDAGEILTDSAGNPIINFCWLSVRNGIWTFAAPMIAIYLIDCVFLVLILVSLYRHHKNRMPEIKEKGSHSKLTVALVKASVILLPLLGLTWVLGIFAVNRNIDSFAVSFTAINSLQGVFIFFFHVLRSERVWGWIKEKYTIYSSTHRKAGEHGSADLSGGSKANRAGPVTNSKKSVHNGDKDAVMILESTIDEERPAEEEVKSKSDLTSDEPASVAVETTTVLTESLKDGPTGDAVEATAEAVLTDYPESMPVVKDVMEEVGLSGEQVNLLVEVNEEEQLTVEEVKNKGDLTSDEAISEAVEIAAAEAILTDYRESMEVIEEVGFSSEKVNLLVEDNDEQQITMKEVRNKSDSTSDEPSSDIIETTTAEAVLTDIAEGAEHHGNQQPHLLKTRKDDMGLTVRRKEFHTKLLLHRNEELRNRMESVLGVALSGNTTEVIRDDILLCRLMNKLHPGMIQYIHEETSAEKRIHNVAEFITACKKLKVPEHKICTAGDIIDGKNMDSVIDCLEYLLESSSQT